MVDEWRVVADGCNALVDYLTVMIDACHLQIDVVNVGCCVL